MSAQRRRAYLTRPETARHSNDRIAEQASRYRFVSRVPMLCECGDPDCERIVLISLEAYQELRRDRDAFLTAPGHILGGGIQEFAGTDYWIQRRRLSG